MFIHPRRVLLALVLLFLPALGYALEGRLTFPGGAPGAAAQVSIPGTPGSFRADRDGRFAFPGGIRVPFTVIVTGVHGEIYAPVTVTNEPPNGVVEITLEPALRDSITVVSGVAPNIEAPPAAGTTFVGREDLEDRHPEHLADAVARIAGVQIRGEGPPAVPVVRGLAGGRTLIVFDDARITAERRAGPSATFLDPFSLASIEVSRGPGSVAYGSDAFGGVIHARPRDPVPGQPALRYDINGSFGGRKQKAAGFEWSHDTKGGAFLALLHGREGDDGESANGLRIPNSAFENSGGALRFVAPRRSGVFRAALTLNQSRDTGAPAADSLVMPTYYPKEDSRLLTAGWDSTLNGALPALGIRLGLGSYRLITNRERLPNATTTRQITGADVGADDASLRFTATKMTTHGRLHTGLDLVSRFNLHATGSVDAFDTAGMPTTRTSEVSIDDARKTDAGVFAIYDHSVTSRLSISGGLRADRVQARNSGGFFGKRSRDDDALSGHAALSLAPRAGLTATLQVASGYREPTLSDRYFRGVNGRGFVVGNPDLEPERSLQYDGVVRWQQGARSVALLAYHYRIRDLIERFRAGNDFQFRNRGEGEVKGAELELTTPLGLGLSLTATGALARGEVLDDGAPLDDIAPPTAHIAFQWSNGRGSAFVHSFFFAQDDRPGPVEVSRPGYTTVDLGAGWRVVERAEIRVLARNVADRSYAGSADANAARAPGRSLTVALSGRF